MKKMIVLMTGFAALIAGAYGSNYLFAQGGGGAPATPQVQQGTKVAVVNIGLVFNQYKRAITMKAELERELEPFKVDAKKLTDQMKKWAEDMRDPRFDVKNEEHYKNAIRKSQRDLEDLDVKVKNLLGKKQEQNLVTLWREVNMGIEAVAKAYGFQIVLGYGDPVEKDMLHLFPNVNRKMQAMDLGSTVPLYVHGSVDLSQTIVDTLNGWLKAQEGKGVTGTPTSGTK